MWAIGVKLQAMGLEVQFSILQSGKDIAGVRLKGEADVVVCPETLEPLDMACTFLAEIVRVVLAQFPKVDGHERCILRCGVAAAVNERGDKGTGKECVLDAEVALPPAADNDGGMWVVDKPLGYRFDVGKSPDEGYLGIAAAQDAAGTIGGTVGHALAV